MCIRRLVVAVVVTILIAAPEAPLLAQDAAATDVDMAGMMQAWEAYMTPGDEHAEIARRAGSWTTTVTMWTAPGAEPSVSSGASEVEPIMGGRYAIERFTGETPWGEFQGLGILGFDNFKQKYVAIWIDSMSTGIMSGESTAVIEDAISYTSDMPNPATESYEQVRSVETWLDENTRRMESWATAADGTEFKNMEIVYQRR